VLIDNDIVDESNLNRQLVFVNDDVGKPKSEALHRRIDERVIYNHTIITDQQMEVTEDNIDFAIPEDSSIVFLCVDNVNARLMINDYLIKKKIPFINGGTMSGHFGEVCTIIPGVTACLRCFMQPDPEKVQCSNQKNPSIVANSMLVSSLMLIEFQNLFMKRPTIPPVLKFQSGRVVDKDIVIDDDPGRKPSEKIYQPFYHLSIKPNPACSCCKK
jgi:molybdopterin/thiamine biosynthesis adenylyltransferase